MVGKSEQAAAELVKGCNGYVSASPSVIVNWSGKTEQVNLFVYSDDDAVLAVQQPDGSFICNDDAGVATVDPLVTIKNPAPGTYKVHVGTAKKDQPALGFLAVTQMSLDEIKLAALDMAPMLRRRQRPSPRRCRSSTPNRCCSAAWPSSDQPICKPASSPSRPSGGRGRHPGVQSGRQEAHVRRFRQRRAELQLHLDRRRRRASA